MDALEDKRDEIAEYEKRLLEKAGQLDKRERENCNMGTKGLSETLVSRLYLGSDFKEVGVELMVDAYTEKVFEEYTF